MRASRDANAKQPAIEAELRKKPLLREQRALAARNKRNNHMVETFQYPELDCFSVNFTVNYLSSPFEWAPTAKYEVVLDVPPQGGVVLRFPFSVVKLNIVSNQDANQALVFDTYRKYVPIVIDTQN